MPEHPAELPAEGEGGTGRVDWSRFHVGVGGPSELPPAVWARIAIPQLVSEVFRLRDRVHAAESNILAVKMRAGAVATGLAFGGGVGGPNELPEGEGTGGSGGVIHWPGEIHEIAELPIGRFIAELTGLTARFTQFEKQVTQRLDAITQRLDAMRK